MAGLTIRLPPHKTPHKTPHPLSGHAPAAAAAKSLQSCPTLCDAIDGSPPGSSIHGIFQARVLEWGALPSPVTPQVLVNPKLLSVCIDVPVLGISDKRNHTVGGLLCLAYLTCWAQGSPMLEQAAVLYSFLCVARSPL